MTPRTRTASRSTPLRSPERAIGLFLGAAILAVLIVAPALSTGSVVDRLTVDNPTAYDVNVEIAASDRDGWLDLGTVGRESESVLEAVADPGGGTLVIRFSYAGVEAGDTLVTRPGPQDGGWRVTVPVEVGERLADVGFGPSAR
jgi:hypothetical protein